MNAGSSSRVVLVHGLWLNGAAMMPLGHRLLRSGFQVTRFSYPSMRLGLDDNARQLAAFCMRLDVPRLYLAGHSLGGLLVLKTLHQHREMRVHRAVLMGSPYWGSIAASALARSNFGQRILGETMQDWLRRPRPSVPEGVELGVIAGNLSLGLGRLVAQLPEPNDGVVCVEETRVPGARDSVVLHINHSGMLFSPEVANAACGFLKNGSFRGV